jgi:hypothetical protein
LFKLNKKENEKTKIIREPLFGCFAIGILMLLSLIPFESIAVPPGGVDSGNYISDDHDTHIAYYNFNDIYTYENEDEEDIEYVWDDSGRDKKGLLKFDTTGTSEKDNNIDGNAALTFDGDGDYVHVNSSSDFNISGRNFVISAMIKTSSENNELTICSRGDYGNNGFTFCLESGLLTFRAWDSGFDTIYDIGGSDLRDGNWHYVAIEYYQATARLYVDPSIGNYGQVEIDSTFQFFPANSTSPFYIGRGQSDYFEGAIDFVYFYAIETQYFPTPTTRDRMFGKENVGYWPMDEGYENIGQNWDIVNDLVRSDFHSYGQVSNPNQVDYVSVSQNTAPGTHGLQFTTTAQRTQHGSVVVDDTDNYLDFDCNPEQDDIYLECWINIEDSEENQIVIEKWDWNGEDDAYGYRLYLDYDPFLEEYELKFQLANSTITTLTGRSIVPNYWHHVWAWSVDGTMHTHVEGGLRPDTTDNTTNSNGIGQTENDLLFAFGYPVWYNDDSPYWPFIGTMDDVVIGRCYPE